MKDITGFGTTEDEFEALPIAVRRKVIDKFMFLCFRLLFTTVLVMKRCSLYVVIFLESLSNEFIIV